MIDFSSKKSNFKSRLRANSTKKAGILMCRGSIKERNSKMKFFDVCLFTARDETPFIFAASSTLADRVQQQLFYHFHRSSWKQLSKRRRGLDLSSKDCNYNVYLESRSMPFINRIPRHVARHIQRALKDVLEVKSIVRYWRPGTAGEFVRGW